jgi:hypothetical protein
MSEQPQEWTPETVAATLKDRPFAASTIASHHNAALAAEREKRRVLVEALEQIAQSDGIGGYELANIAAEALAKIR